MIHFLMPKSKTPCRNCNPSCMEDDGYPFPGRPFRDLMNSRFNQDSMDIRPTYIYEDPYYKYQFYCPGHEYADDLGYVHFEDEESLEQFIKEQQCR